ncbi:hypothetical protein GQ55_2G138300 [Panicum hallii var. hallii]|uniref:Retrotransposon gag domain-containing protein n=1 Tax=Panicum hallii var. hallii TaxID=1504633 RepID=A0A2T7EPM1_9POAL|nr:hypothetical protein GQ55_2G138300 [Panicum hallii var. hallii]
MPKAHGSTFESSTRPRSSDSGEFLMEKLPKVPFPIFDGENPKLWISRCEKYFVIYHVDPSMWVKVSVMQFSGAAARWFQAVEKRLAHDSWPDLCKLVLKRFGKEQFSGLVDQLLAILEQFLFRGRVIWILLALLPFYRKRWLSRLGVVNFASLTRDSSPSLSRRVQWRCHCLPSQIVILVPHRSTTGVIH